MASAGLQTTTPLPLGFLLEAGPALLTAAAGSLPITGKTARLAPGGSILIASVPLTIGGLLITCGQTFTLPAGTVTVPITGQTATLSVPSAAADVATSSPLSLGFLLATNGSSAYVLSASAGSVPITAQTATLVASGNPADVQTTVPLVLGLLLTVASFTLTADPTTVILDFSPGAGEDFEGPTVNRRVDGGEQRKRKRQEQDERDLIDILGQIADLCH